MSTLSSCAKLLLAAILALSSGCCGSREERASATKVLEGIDKAASTREADYQSALESILVAFFTLQQRYADAYWSEKIAALEAKVQRDCFDASHRLRKEARTILEAAVKGPADRLQTEIEHERGKTPPNLDRISFLQAQLGGGLVSMAAAQAGSCTATGKSSCGAPALMRP